MKELQKELQWLNRANSFRNLSLEVLKRSVDETGKRMNLLAYQRVGMPQKIFDILSAEMSKRGIVCDELNALQEKIYQAEDRRSNELEAQAS